MWGWLGYIGEERPKNDSSTNFLLMASDKYGSVDSTGRGVERGNGLIFGELEFRMDVVELERERVLMTSDDWTTLSLRNS